MRPPRADQVVAAPVFRRKYGGIQFGMILIELLLPSSRRRAGAVGEGDDAPHFLAGGRGGLGTVRRGAVNLGWSGLRAGAGAGSGRGVSGKQRRACVATPAERGRRRPAMNNRTPAAPRKSISESGMPCACSTGRAAGMAAGGASFRARSGAAAAGGAETGAGAAAGARTGGTRAAGEGRRRGSGGSGAGEATREAAVRREGTRRAALISARVQRVCGLGSAA